MLVSNIPSCSWIYISVVTVITPFSCIKSRVRCVRISLYQYAIPPFCCFFEPKHIVFLFQTGYSPFIVLSAVSTSLSHSDELRIAVFHQRFRARPPQDEDIAILRRQGDVRIRSVALNISIAQHSYEHSCIQVGRVDHADIAGCVVQVLQLLGEGP